MQFIFPFLGCVYLTLVNMNVLPFSMVANCAFMGLSLMCLVIFYPPRKKKFDGELEMDPTDPNKDLYSLVLDIPLEELPNRKTLTLKVKGGKQ